MSSGGLRSGMFGPYAARFCGEAGPAYQLVPDLECQKMLSWAEHGRMAWETVSLGLPRDLGRLQSQCLFCKLGLSVLPNMTS